MPSHKPWSNGGFTQIRIIYGAFFIWTVHWIHEDLQNGSGRHEMVLENKLFQDVGNHLML